MTLITVYNRVFASAVILITLWLGGVGCSFCCASTDRDSCCLRESKSRSSTLANSSTCDTGSSCSCCKSQTIQRQRQNDAAIDNHGLVGCSLLPHRVDATTVRVNVTYASQQ